MAIYGRSIVFFTTCLFALTIALPYEEHRARAFEQTVRQASITVERVLGAARAPKLPGEVHHGYDDKYALVEAQINTAVALHVETLRALGLKPKDLSKLVSWAAAEEAVTLHFEAQTSCTFARNESHDVETDRQMHEQTILGMSVGTTTSSVITTVTEFFWNFKANWKLTAYRGTGHKDADAVQLSSRSAALEIKTATNRTPYPAYDARPHIDMSLTWLMQQVSIKSGTGSPHMDFTINREAPSCHTPRRNADVEKALQFGPKVTNWHQQVQGVMRQLYSIQAPHHGPHRMFEAGDSVFLPPIVFETPDTVPQVFACTHANTTRMGATAESIVIETEGSSCEAQEGGEETGATLLNVTAINLLLREAAFSLHARCDSISETIAEASKAADIKLLISGKEACLVVSSKYASRLWSNVADGVAYVENMLMKQLVAAVGKVVQPSDFDAYMQHHNRRVFRREYLPRSFVHSIRRSPGHSPEGSIRIEDPTHSNPIMTIHSVTEEVVQNASSSSDNDAVSDPSVMTFDLNAETTISFSGAVHLHAWINHKFSGVGGLNRLVLKAAARQFSSFIVLVGRITGPSSFQPRDAVIIKDRDELDIPMSLSTLPTAKEFRDAVSSLSPEQQRFATAIRSMQLESTLLGILVLQIKPQLEVLLNLPTDSLTKEIALTQDLMEMFTKYQIPADLLSFTGEEEASGSTRLTAVKDHVASIRSMIQRSERDPANQRGSCKPYPTVSATRVASAAEPSASFYATRSSGAHVQSMSSSSTSSSTSTSEAKPDAGNSAGVPSSSVRPDDAPTATGSPAPPASVASPATQDLTQLPALLDREFLRYDGGAALRPTIVTPDDHGWVYRSYPSLMCKTAGVQSWSRYGGDLVNAKAAAFDLIDALSRSGALTLKHASLHILVAATHNFADTLLDTVVQKNINPIEAVERSQLIVASTIHGVPAGSLVTPEHISIAALHSPDLLTAPETAKAAPNQYKNVPCDDAEA